METTTEITSHTKNNEDVKNFYISVGIIAFTIIVLHPLAMLFVIILQALTQA